VSSAPSHPDDDEFDDEDYDSPLEEISDCYSEEYEDDFEDEPYSDEDIEPSDIDEEVYMAHGAGALSTVREEEELTRVLNNYEQDLARNYGSASPSPSPQPPRRQASYERMPAAAPASAGPVPGGAIMDLRSRASRLKEELMRKMGEETFKKAFEFLYQARLKGAEERAVKRDLEALVGRETYKQFCFDVDQLVFQQLTYGGTSRD